jgi:helicase
MDRMPVEGLEQFGIPRACIEKLKQRDIVTLQGVQVKAIEAGLFDRTDLVISAPTTSGKTLIAELALLKHSIEAKGCFFLVSHKALAEEKYMHFRANYADPTKPWFKVAVSTGDRTQFDEELADYQIIVATYEKLYGLLNANPSMADWISLVVIDELQTLGDPARGATLESLVTKMKQLNGSIQIIALSATVPNVQEMARWLKAQACISTTRPVPLEEWIWSKNRFLSKRFGSKAIEEQSPLSVELDTFSVVDHHAGQGDIPVLVFAITRSRTQDLARELAAPRSIRRDMQRYVDEVSAVTENTPASRVLIEVMRKGIGFHTADLSFAEKEIVERAFREGALDIVVATTTLAAGINTPAKTVIFDSIYRHWLHDYIGVEEYVNNLWC